MKNLKLKTALAAVTLAAASLATPLSAHANDGRCADTSSTVLGAITGGVAGAAIGDGVARRGQSTEIGILGAVLGGLAGAAVGDSISGCENYDPRRTSAPVYTQPTSAPVYTQPTTVYSTPQARTVYTSPRIVTQAPVYTTPAPVYRTNTSFSNNRGFNNNQNRLFQIDREIDRLCHEIDFLKAERRRSRGRRNGLRNRIKELEFIVADLERERRQIRKFGHNSRNSFRSY